MNLVSFPRTNGLLLSITLICLGKQDSLFHFYRKFHAKKKHTRVFKASQVLCRGDLKHQYTGILNVVFFQGEVNQVLHKYAKTHKLPKTSKKPPPSKNH